MSSAYSRGEIKTFQIVILGVFGFFIVAGVIAFATFRGGGGGSGVPDSVSIWGTLPEEHVKVFLNEIRLEVEDQFPVEYREIGEESFDRELVEALAALRGPDMVFLPQDRILRHGDKVTLIPYETVSLRDYRDAYVEESELYLTPQGALGLPFAIDPIVLYWNRTLLTNAGIASPPRSWDDFALLVPALTERDQRGNITQSAIAFGEFANVSHAKEILAMLIMQAGGAITGRRETGDLRVLLTERGSGPEIPAEAALRFYTEFADPVKELYTWNRSLPNSLEAFLAGDVAFYVGFGSELAEIQERNPNLNFDMARIPQVEGVNARITYGRMYALSVLAQSRRQESAFRALGIISESDVLARWSVISDLPPVRRDMLGGEGSNAFQAVLSDGALIARGFLDPSPSETRSIFQLLIEDVTSGRLRVTEAVRTAQDRMSSLIR